MQTLAVQTQAQPQTVMITPTATPSRFIQNQVICQQNHGTGLQGEKRTQTHTHKENTHMSVVHKAVSPLSPPAADAEHCDITAGPANDDPAPACADSGRSDHPDAVDDAHAHHVSTSACMSHAHVYPQFPAAVHNLYSVYCILISNCVLIGPQLLVHQPQILKTDSLVLTTLKPDGTQVLSTVQNPTGITTLTAPIQTTALQVPVSHMT